MDRALLKRPLELLEQHSSMTAPPGATVPCSVAAFAAAKRQRLWQQQQHHHHSASSGAAASLPSSAPPPAAPSASQSSSSSSSSSLSPAFSLPASHARHAAHHHHLHHLARRKRSRSPMDGETEAEEEPDNGSEAFAHERKPELYTQDQVDYLREQHMRELQTVAETANKEVERLSQENRVLRTGISVLNARKDQAEKELEATRAMLMEQIERYKHLEHVVALHSNMRVGQCRRDGNDWGGGGGGAVC